MEALPPVPKQGPPPWRCVRARRPDLPHARHSLTAAIIVAPDRRSTVRRNTGWKPMLH
jgi:hypothetical protein